MSLTHSDVLHIQSAIDAYEKKFPGSPSPSAAEALAWQAGKRGTSNPAKATAVSGGKALSGSFKLSARRWFGAINVFRRSSAIS